jgi:hypothetical protein
MYRIGNLLLMAGDRGKSDTGLLVVTSCFVELQLLEMHKGNTSIK